MAVFQYKYDPPRSVAPRMSSCLLSSTRIGTRHPLMRPMTNQTQNRFTRQNEYLRFFPCIRSMASQHHCREDHTVILHPCACRGEKFFAPTSGQDPRYTSAATSAAATCRHTEDNWFPCAWLMKSLPAALGDLEVCGYLEPGFGQSARPDPGLT